MINIDNEIITMLDTAITQYQSSAIVSTEYSDRPSAFPYIYVGLSNSLDESKVDSSMTEKYTNYVITLDIYTNKNVSPLINKQLCTIIDNTLGLKGLGMYRNSYNKIVNSADSSIYHSNMTYRGKVGITNKIYKL